eukprot:Phypoly_transcript_02882.p1 GENE.Phypoly_transcript_02882~~Phypoly_transcript_02882.p1  ORF type:complete len:833 (+),score=72.23 Phypoly_transcript_02882:121-2619(+)
MAAVKYSSCINQYLLERQLKQLFPHDKTYVDSKKQLKIKYPFSGKHLELDVWIPKKNIGFEFQDLYHYVTTWYAQHTLDHIHQKDAIKKESVEQMGITLVFVPCWWDGTLGSLAATIHSLRPELISYSKASPIHLNPPQDYFPKSDVPGVGELMLASFPRDLDFDPTEIDHSWWMGEKYDGIRCCWNPSTSQLYSRSGRRVPLHGAFKRHFPHFFLDGEIWFGRGMFALTSTLFAGAEIVSWHALRMIFFDTPPTKLQPAPFEMRYEHVLHELKTSCSFSIIAPRILCHDSAHLNALMEEVIRNGGEGMIARRVGSPYLQGRSASLIKFKTAYADKEALVIGLDQGSVLLKIPNGDTFTVQLDDVLIPIPAKGEIVTFSYEPGSRRDFPTNPKICKVRTDLNWEDVAASYVSDRSQLNHFSQVKSNVDFNDDISSRPLSKSTQAPISVTWNDVSNRRKFFENYAREIGFDPLIATNWYSQQMESIMSFKGAARVLFYHQNSASRALLDLFPDIGLNQDKLWPEKLSQNTLMLHVKAKSIQIFEKYARENRFDPLNPSAWVSQTKKRVLSNKGIARVVSLHYRGKVSKALSDLFPSFAAVKPKWIAPIGPDPWDSEYTRRDFFEKYARENGFDPRDAENWHAQSRSNILASKGALRVISYHEGKVSRALLDLFPDIGLDETKFSWNILAKRRNFFKNYAKQQGFDHRDPENWYRHREKVLSMKGAANIIQNHQHSLSKTLIDLFPDIGLDKAKLRNGPIWPDREARKRFFVNYASSRGFDPRDPDRWYAQPKIGIWTSRGGQMIGSFYKGSVPGALTDLFPDMPLDVTKFKYS